MKLVMILLMGMTMWGQLTINAPAITVDAESSAAILKWMATQTNNAPGANDLEGAIDNVTTTVILRKNVGIGGNSVIAIDDEHMQVTNRTGNVLTVTRGHNGTTAAAHSSGAKVNELKYKTPNQLGKQIMLDVLRKIVEQYEVDLNTQTVINNAKAKANTGVQ